MWQPVHTLSKTAEAVVEFWRCVLDYHRPRFLQEVAGVRETWVDLPFPYNRDLWVWEATSLACGLLSEDEVRGLRNYAMPFLLVLHPDHGHLLQRGFPVCLVLRDSCFDISWLYSHTQSFQKESVGPHLKNRDGNIYKRRSQFGAI